MFGFLKKKISGFIDGLTRSTSEAVRAGRVGVQLREVRHHRLDRLRAHRRGRSMVEIGDGRFRHLGHATEYIRGQTRDVIRYIAGLTPDVIPA